MVVVAGPPGVVAGRMGRAGRLVVTRYPGVVAAGMTHIDKVGWTDIAVPGHGRIHR